MFEALKAPPPDKIIQLIGMYAADPRTEKLDLGVGVYKDPQGSTPIMRAVKAAEHRLWKEQETKTYLSVLGDKSFVTGMAGLILGDSVAPERIGGGQTPGGTGAVRQLAELVKRATPDATVWYSDPTWPNHPQILAHVGLAAKTYRYYDAEAGAVSFEAMCEDLKAAKAGDVVILHGCCHNPTGANLSLEQWQALTAQIGEQGLVPFVDLAYQGFGDGLEEDVAGLRHLAATLPEVMLAASCSKNFGLYRDRVGAAIVIGKDAEAAKVTEANIGALNRLNFSFPPDHGAKVVSLILHDAELRADWIAELEDMRLNMLTLRKGLAEALRREANSDRFDYIAVHRGMFTQLGGTLEKVAKLREEHGVYMVGTGRINIAGLPADGLDKLAKAIVAVGI
ncbi:MAG: aspartate/tyrosine/aromatic aminotransferase [Rhodobacteraceae bacterium]|uniref:amino acid aminotransferase n=1 Tax=Amaricoccus sp. B4 TaxID=3368557 RepID=UPI000DACC5D0|nr:aspartate/tyrosine/aromatic aminotransferase [Paracoccaceae bacterium]